MRLAARFWYKLLEPSTLYREATLGCVSCGDCIQDHLNYAGCTMRWCYKELRNGPCGGSRMDGTCEARPELPCIWNLVYLGDAGRRRRPEEVRAHVDSAAGLVPGPDQRAGQSFGGPGQPLQATGTGSGAEKAAEGSKNYAHHR